ncbi:hypothetical protein JKF63_01239 [Porcisia hertigi]|uniref:USP domain-containing protein n=1 Tax=Porcisia hertigi TaxID=2761500 RepID=A0A836HXP8_9TRYP|nr:hypothetical protein JKF63_01239 [Porcisia hertigi]
MSSGDGSNGALAPFKLSSWHCISAAPATRTTPSVDVAKGAPELAAATARGPAPTSVASVIDIRNGPTPPNGFLPLLNVPHMQSRTAMPPIAKNDSVASIVAVSDEASSSSRAPCHQPRPPPPRHPGPTSIVKGSSSSSTSSDRAPSSTAVLAEPLSEMQLHRAPIPLRNFGATCYLNSIVQCLVCTPGFLHALENERRRIASESAEKRCSSRNRAPGDAHERSCADRHAPATSLLIHLGTAHPAHHHPVQQLLLSLKLACAEFNDEFSSNGQNDAHELLITLLGVIDREVCRSKPGIYEAFKDLENEKKSEAYARWVYRLQQENNSAVYDFFGGITGCTIKCESCNLSSYRFEATLDISLPVTYRTRPRGANGTTGLSGKASNNATEAECVATVDELLRDLFLSERGEFLSGPMQVTCDRCKKLRDKTIWSSMEQWPPILVLHLKRFDNAGVKNGAAVVFPYTFSPCRRVKYQLYAVCCHRGTSSFGHYTSYTYVERKDAPAAPRGDPVSSAALSDRTEGSVNSSNRDQRTNVEGCHQSGRIGASGAREGSCRGKGGDGAPGGGNRGHNETNIVNGRDRAISAGNTTRTGKWYLCNDQKIMEVTAADVLSMTKEVYILFYRQVDGGFGTTL